MDIINIITIAVGAIYSRKAPFQLGIEISLQEPGRPVHTAIFYPVGYGGFGESAPLPEVCFACIKPGLPVQALLECPGFCLALWAQVAMCTGVAMSTSSFLVHPYTGPAFRYTFFVELAM